MLLFLVIIIQILLCHQEKITFTGVKDLSNKLGFLLDNGLDNEKKAEICVIVKKMVYLTQQIFDCFEEEDVKLASTNKVCFCPCVISITMCMGSYSSFLLYSSNE